jgi:hypothetical protein
MAPAALMEADIQPAVEEVGGAIGADDAVTIVTPYNPVPQPLKYKTVLWDEDYNELTGTVTKKLSKHNTADKAFLVRVESQADYDNVTWKLSNNTVAARVLVAGANNDNYYLKFLKAGKVKITATPTLKGKAVKSVSFTLKVTDDTKKASSIKIVPDETDSRYSSKKGTFNTSKSSLPLAVEADVKSYDNDYTVKWTLDTVSYATLASYDLTKVNKKTLDANSNDYVLLVPTGKTGDVKLTAKVGKIETTLKIKVGPQASKGIFFNQKDMYVSPETDPLDANHEYMNMYLWTYKRSDKKFEKSTGYVRTYYGSAKNDVNFKANILRSFTWKSSDKSIATVAKAKSAGRAKITAKKAGEAKITVSKKDYASNSFKVRILDNAPSGIRYVDNYADLDWNDDATMYQLTLYKGQIFYLTDVIEIDFPNYVGDSMNNLLWVKGFATFTHSGSDCAKLLDKDIGKIKAVKVGSDAYFKVKTFNGKTATLKVKVID